MYNILLKLLKTNKTLFLYSLIATPYIFASISENTNKNRSFNPQIEAALFDAEKFNHSQDSLFTKRLNWPLEDTSTSVSLAFNSYKKNRLQEKLTTYQENGWELTPFGTSEEDIGGLIAFKNKKVLIAFHGTEDLNDILIDATFNQVSTQSLGFTNPDSKVHNGFLSRFLKLRNSLITSLDKIITDHGLSSIDDLDAIYFSGHSLGGALATIASAYLNHHYHVMEHIKFTSTDSDFDLVDFDRPEHFKKVPFRIISMGSPRVFNFEGAQEFDELFGEKSHLRFVAYPDIVPSVPMGSIGYKHTGTFVELKFWKQLNITVDSLKKSFEKILKGDKLSFASLAFSVYSFSSKPILNNVFIKTVLTLHSSSGYKDQAIAWLTKKAQNSNKREWSLRNFFRDCKKNSSWLYKKITKNVSPLITNLKVFS